MTRRRNGSWRSPSSEPGSRSSSRIFPEWRENLRFPEPELREGEFIFQVSLGKIWRLIAMPAGSTLDDLIGQILNSVDFDFDHLYEFTYRDRLGANVSSGNSDDGDGPASLTSRSGRCRSNQGSR